MPALASTVVLAAVASPSAKRSNGVVRLTSDSALIRACASYAQAVAAHEANSEADPVGSSKHAATLGNRHSERAAQMLERIAATSATTAAGLQAKARILPILMKDTHADLGAIGGAAVDFVNGFADEVRLLLELMVNQE